MYGWEIRILLKHYRDKGVSETRTNETMMHGVWYGVVFVGRAV